MPQLVLEVGRGRGELAERMAKRARRARRRGRPVGADGRADRGARRRGDRRRRRGSARSGTGSSTARSPRGCSTTCRTSAGAILRAPPRATARRAARRRHEQRADTCGELWELVGETARRPTGSRAENGEGALLRHFTIVERRDVRGTVTFPDREAAHRYISASSRRSGHLADRLPHLRRPARCSRHVVVFVCEP